MDWLLYNNGLRHERVKGILCILWKKNLKGTLWLRYTGWVSLCQSLSELKVKS